MINNHCMMVHIDVERENIETSLTSSYVLATHVLIPKVL